MKETKDIIEFSNSIKCGEIFVTSTNFFTYFCTFCNLDFIKSEIYISHFLRNHDLKQELQHKLDIECLKETKIELRFLQDSTEINCKNSDIKFAEERNIIDLNSNTQDNLQPVIIESLEKIDEKVEPCNVVEKIIKSNDGELTSIEKKIQFDGSKQCKLMFQKGIKKVEHEAQNVKKEIIQLICETCGKVFKARRSLQIHLRIHTGEKPFACQFCPMTFAQLGVLNNHERQHTGHRPYKCKFCDKSFFQRGLMTTHQLLHTLPEKPYQCPVCQKRFLRKHNLNDHTNTHKYNPKKPYSCPQCPKYFKTMASLKCHEIFHRTDEYKFSCDYCDKKFPKLRMKVNHELKHTLAGKTPHKCDICDKSYARYGSLLKHKRKWHSAGNLVPRNYLCRYCNRTFKKEGAKDNHEKVHETQSCEPKIFRCDLCDKKYNFRSGLQKHKRKKHSESLLK